MSAGAPELCREHQAACEAVAMSMAAPAAVTAPAGVTSFEELRGNLPEHHAEVMAAHQGSPSVAVQSATHGAPAPVPDHGTRAR